MPTFLRILDSFWTQPYGFLLAIGLQQTSLMQTLGVHQKQARSVLLACSVFESFLLDMDGKRGKTYEKMLRCLRKKRKRAESDRPEPDEMSCFRLRLEVFSKALGGNKLPEIACIAL